MTSLFDPTVNSEALLESTDAGLKSSEVKNSYQ